MSKNNGKEPQSTCGPGPDMQEQSYEIALVIRVTGYGNQEQQRKDAANVKRLLDVGLQKDNEVFMAPNLKAKTTKLIPVTWKVPR